MVSKDDPLFPTPAPPPSLVAPARWPGITPHSVEVLKKVLKDNHDRWHIFFNDRNFHNHIAHRILAVWAVGADGSVIEAGYKTDSTYQRPNFASPTAITSENFREHLTKAEYWDAYVKFFEQQVQELGIRDVIEKYVFSREFNFDHKLNDDEQVRMLDRFVGGLFHPLIHVGYGYEFGLPGIIAEGLALTALSPSAFRNTITPELFDKAGVKGLTGTSAQLAKELDIASTAKPTTGIEAKSTHALTIVARILKDARFAEAKNIDPANAFTETREKFGDLIREYVEQWDADTSDPKEVTRKHEELVWTSVVLYGVVGLHKENEFKADFLLMHIVTSSLFLPSLLAFLSSPSQALLLRSFFTASLSYWIASGRPNINIKRFFSSTETAYPLPTGALPTPTDDTLPPPDADPNRVKAVTPNPWLPIIETSLTHPNEHLIKLQRTLAHHSALYGSREPGAKEGGLRGAAEELEGAEFLDGTLFIRVAGLTAKRLGRVREGEKSSNWDFGGFI
ncbi:Protein of unknown function (DUF4243) domain containing protein [Amanita muscaria]